MGKIIGIEDTFFDDMNNVRMHPFAKAIFLYLYFGHRSVSGIYKRALDLIEFMSKVPIGDVRHLLVNDEVNGIRYDEKNSTVFVKDKFRLAAKLGGAKALLARSILADYESTSESRDLWLEWGSRYGHEIEANDDLREHFSLLKSCEIVSIPTLRKARPEHRGERESEVEIQRHLSRYTKQLDSSDLDAVLALYSQLTEQAGETARVKFLRDLAEYDVELILKAAHDFISDPFPGKKFSRSTFLYELKRADEESVGKGESL